AGRPGAAAAEEPGHLVAGDAVQPAAERPLPGVVVPAARRLRDREKDFLGQVGRVGVLQAAVADEAVDEAAVQLDELAPGRAVARVGEAGDQAGAGPQGVSHGPTFSPANVPGTPRAARPRPPGRGLPVPPGDAA